MITALNNLCMSLFSELSSDMSPCYQLRVIVYPSGLSTKPKKPLFEKYIVVPLEDVRFSSIIDVLKCFWSFPVDIEFHYEPV